MSQGIEQVKKHLSSQNEQERLRALPETLNYGQQGLELLIAQSLHDKSERVKHLAYRIFRGDNPYVKANTSESLVSCPTDIITSLAISSDNTLIVGGSWQKTWVWYLQSGEIVLTLKEHSHWVLSVAISHDRNTLVTGSADATVKVWNLKTGQLIRTLSGHSSWVTSVAISADGKKIVSGSIDKTIKIWDLITGKLSKTLKNENELSSVLNLCISYDGKAIACGSTNNKITLWNLDSGQLIHSIEEPNNWIESLSITSDNSTLISGSRNGWVKVWQSKSEEKYSNESSSFWGKGLVDVAATVAGFSLGFPIALGAWALGRFMVGTGDNGDVSPQPFQKLECIETYDNKVAISSLACNINQNIIVLGCQENIIVRELKDNKVIYSLPMPCGFINSVAVSSDGKIIIIAGNAWVILLNSRTGKPLHALKGCSYPKLSKIAILEIPSELLYFQSQQFNVKGFDQNNREMSLNFQDVTWEASGGKIEQGLFIAGEEKGKFEIKAQIGIFKAFVLVTIIDPPRITNLSITPSSITLEWGKSQQFTAKILDQRRNLIQANVSWEAKEGGKINKNGQFIAGTKSGNYEIIASVDSIHRVIPVTIIEILKLTKLIIISSPSKLEFGESFHFQVKGLDQCGNNIQTGEITWSTSSGKINNEGKFCADKREKSVIIEARVGDIYTSTTIKVWEPSRLTEIRVVPPSVTLEPGEEQNFCVVAFNQHFIAKILDQRSNFMQETVCWEVKEGGTIDQNGNFIAGSNPGNFEIIASVGSIRRVIPVTIIEIPKLTKLIIISSPSKLEWGESFQFQVKGLDQCGNNIQTGEITWSTSSGKINNEGKFCAGKREERVIIEARVGDICTSTTIKIYDPSRLAEIRVVPPSVTLEPGEEQNFCVVAFNQGGKKIAVGGIEWKATDGLIDHQTGCFYTREDQKGYCQVSAKVKNLSASVEVFVPTVLRELRISPKHVELKPEKEFTFTVHGFDQAGAPLEIRNVGWTTTVGGSISYTGTFKGNYKKREVTVTATVANIRATAKVIFLPILRCLKIQPGFVYLKPNEKQAFVVKGFDQFGAEVEPGDVYWKTTGGEINQDGILAFERHEQGYFQVTVTSQLAPKYSQNIKTLLFYTGISSKIISYFISDETPLQDLFALVSGSTDREKQLNSSRVGVTRLDINTQTTEETEITTLQADKLLDIKIDQSADDDISVNTNLLDFFAALEEFFSEKLQELVDRIFLFISRFCLSEASANVSACADVFILAVEDNPYKYFECITTLYGHWGLVSSLAITPDGKKLISGSWDSTIKIWDLSAGELFDTLEAHTNDVECLAIAPNGQTLVSGGWDETIKFWDLNTSELLSTLECTEEVTVVAITPDGQKLVTGETHNLIKVWDLKNQTILKEVRNSLDTYNHPCLWHKYIVITPNGKKIISAVESIVIYDLETGEVVNNLRPKIKTVYSLAITADGKKLISGHNREVKIWDLKAKYPKILLNLKSLAKEVCDLVVMPDDRIFISCGLLAHNDLENDLEESDPISIIEFWDLNTGEKIHCIEDYDDNGIYRLAISPDGKQIITGYKGGLIKIWGIPELN